MARKTGKRAAGETDGPEARRTGTGTPAPNGTRQSAGARRLVDVDLWAMLLEGLMEMPEEDAPAEREGGNRG